MNSITPDVKPQIISPGTVDGGTESDTNFIVVFTVVTVTFLVCGVIIVVVFVVFRYRRRQQQQAQGKFYHDAVEDVHVMYT